MRVGWVGVSERWIRREGGFGIEGQWRWGGGVKVSMRLLINGEGEGGGGGGGGGERNPLLEGGRIILRCGCKDNED